MSHTYIISTILYNVLVYPFSIGLLSLMYNMKNYVCIRTIGLLYIHLYIRCVHHSLTGVK